MRGKVSADCDKALHNHSMCVLSAKSLLRQHCKSEDNHRSPAAFGCLREHVSELKSECQYLASFKGAAPEAKRKAGDVSLASTTVSSLLGNFAGKGGNGVSAETVELTREMYNMCHGAMWNSHVDVVSVVVNFELLELLEVLKLWGIFGFLGLYRLSQR
jgi:hypothetical protein